ncbi:hypothetical protein [Promicromonospora sp. NPDC050880]|uniref:hypothetical protein n=1 Tax=Promicromonospora sp. NPDC050880 TaxID=3364406 RepID=UPI0037A57E0A
MTSPGSATRWAIDAVTALRIVRDDVGVGTRRTLVGPAVLRSHVLSMLYRQVRAGLLDDETARAELNGLATLKIRLLGDRVSRATAWTIARRLDWDDTMPAEYLAVATLQADVLVAGDERIATAAGDLIPVADYDDLIGAPATLPAPGGGTP